MILLWDLVTVNETSRFYALTYIQLIILIWLAENILTNPDQMELLMKVFIFINIFTFVSTIRNFNFFNETNVLVRISGEAGNANTFAIYIGVSSIFSFYFYEIEQKKIQKAFWLVVALFLIIPIFLSGSRGGFLFLIIVLAYLLYRFKKATPLIISLLFLIVLINSDLLGRSYIEQMLNIPKDILTQSDTIGTRIGLWRYGITLWKEKPILGIGTGTFILRSINSPFLRSGVNLVAHSSYITHLVENGVIGLLLFLILNLIAIINYENVIKMTKKTNFKLNRLAIIWEAVLLLYALNGLKGNQQIAKILWLSFGISLVLLNQANLKSKTEKEQKDIVETKIIPSSS
jgi:O-antigen ligase